MGTRRSWGCLPLLVAVVLLAGACGAAPRKDSSGTMGTNGAVEHILLRNVYLVASGEGGYDRRDDGLVRLWLFNTSVLEDALVEVRSPRAESARIGWDRECDGTFDIVPELPLLPEGTVPYGQPYVVELVGFTDKVRGGTTVPLTLTFRHAGETRLDAMVEVVDDGDVSDPVTCTTTSGPTAT